VFAACSAALADDPPGAALPDPVAIGVVRQSLTTALQHDDVEAAAAAVLALLRRGMEPANVAMTTLSSLSPRVSDTLRETLIDSRASGVAEVVMLLAAGSGDWSAVDSLSRSFSGRPVSVATLQTVAGQAEEAGQFPVAAWAYSRLRGVGQMWAEHATLPLVEALIASGRRDEAAVLLDSLMGGETPPNFRTRAAVLRARILLMQGDETRALDWLDRVPRNAPERAEAELWAALIRFSHHGNDSLARILEAAARLLPGSPAAAAAYGAAQLTACFPSDIRLRQKALHSLQLELREQYEAAADGYREVRKASRETAAVRWGIREARCWERAGRIASALETWASLDSSGDDGAVVLIGTGDCLATIGMPDSARACYMAVLDRFPESAHAGQARSRLLQ
jgi:tetratricopeptide (TPR) repeat protein